MTALLILSYAPTHPPTHQPFGTHIMHLRSAIPMNYIDVYVCGSATHAYVRKFNNANYRIYPRFYFVAGVTVDICHKQHLLRKTCLLNDFLCVSNTFNHQIMMFVYIYIYINRYVYIHMHVYISGWWCTKK